MPHYFVIVHNKLSELTLKGFLINNTLGSKVISIPASTPKEQVIDAIKLKIPPGVGNNSFTFFAEANYGQPAQPVVNSELFGYLLGFEDARIIAHSSTVGALIKALEFDPRIEVMVTADESGTIDQLKDPNFAGKDYSDRIVTKQSFKSPEVRRLRALTESIIEFQPQPPVPLLPQYETQIRARSNTFSSISTSTSSPSSVPTPIMIPRVGTNSDGLDTTDSMEMDNPHGYLKPTQF